MPFPNEHAGRMKAPGGFKPDSFRRKKIAPGVSMIMGRKKGETTMTAQSVRFDKDKFTAAEARKWLADHDMKPISFEAASSKEAELEKAATADPLAAEIPEITEVEAKMYDDHYPAEPLVPLGATTFAEVDAFRQAQGVHEQVKELTTMFQTLSSNIMWDPTIEDKPGALRGLVDELDGLLADAITEKARPSALQRLVGKAKDLAASVAARLSPEQEKAAGLMVWKEGNRHRWLAVYSNKYRDQDIPPEILSAKAHKEFVEAVDVIPRRPQDHQVRLQRGRVIPGQPARMETPSAQRDDQFGVVPVPLGQSSAAREHDARMEDVGAGEFHIKAG